MRIGFRRGKAAFTLVEVCVAAIVLAIALSGMVAALVAAMSLNRVNRESALAQQAARRVMEEMQGVPFEQIFRCYNDWNGDDAGLTVAARGADFAVTGLDPQDADADNMCGEVFFPTVVVAGAPQLREDVVDAALGTPKDLDLLNGIDTANHTADYVLLPVRVRVQWRGASGDRTLDFEMVLCDR